LTSPFSFHLPPPKLKRLRFGIWSSGFYPRVVCAATRFTSVSAASRLNRGSTSCPAHRRATAVWTRRAIGLVTPTRKRSIFELARQHRKENSYAQEGSYLSAALHITHISTTTCVGARPENPWSEGDKKGALADALSFSYSNWLLLVLVLVLVLLVLAGDVGSVLERLIRVYSDFPRNLLRFCIELLQIR
jgi:hypothetical protein